MNAEDAIKLFLKNERLAGRITPTRPIHAIDLINALRRCFGIVVGSDVQLRPHVRALRIAGEPIGSTANGYFWAEDEDELATTRAQLENRISALAEVLHGLRKSFIPAIPNLFET